MKIDNLITGIYISRPNRFTVEFKNNENKIEKAHLHDPGRLKELLLPETKILIKYISTYKKTGRKTKYDVIAVKNNGVWILLNSSYHNKLVEELISTQNIKGLEKYHVQKAEVTYKNSRLDFLLKDNNDNKLYLEVKGCTLLVENIAKFPDAPTKRGTKHIKELIELRNQNIESAIVILVLHNNAEIFTPNYDTDIEFSTTLNKAYNKNVKIFPLKIHTEFKNNRIILKSEKLLPIQFKEDIKE